MNAKEVYLQFLLAHVTTGFNDLPDGELGEFLDNLGEAFKRDGV